MFELRRWNRIHSLDGFVRVAFVAQFCVRRKQANITKKTCNNSPTEFKHFLLHSAELSVCDSLAVCGFMFEQSFLQECS